MGDLGRDEEDYELIEGVSFLSKSVGERALAIGRDVIESSRWHAFVSLVICVIVAASAWRMSQSSGSPLVHYACIAGFGYLALWSALGTINPERLIVTSEGFYIRPSIGAMKPMVRWSELDGFELYKARHLFLAQPAYRLKGALLLVPMGAGWRMPSRELVDYLEGCRNQAVGPVPLNEANASAPTLSAMGGLGAGLMILAGVTAAAFTWPFMMGRRGTPSPLQWANLEPKQQSVFLIIWAVCAAIGMIGYLVMRKGEARP